MKRFWSSTLLLGVPALAGASVLSAWGAGGQRLGESIRPAGGPYPATIVFSGVERLGAHGVARLAPPDMPPPMSVEHVGPHAQAPAAVPEGPPGTEVDKLGPHRLPQVPPIAAVPPPPGVERIGPQAEAPGPIDNEPVLGRSFYGNDDGVTDLAWSFTRDGDLAWFQCFEAAGWSDTITEVEVAVGLPTGGPPEIPELSPITIGVWDDPTDRGDLRAAVLVSSTIAKLTQSGTGLRTSYRVPPALVHGLFFVGVSVPAAAGSRAAAMDSHTAAHGTTWFAVSEPRGSFDPANLGACTIGPSRLCDRVPALDRTYVLRAWGTSMFPQVYCPPEATYEGCLPRLSWRGTASVSSPQAFELIVTGASRRHFAMLLYTTAGQTRVPFTNGMLCLEQPLRRTPPFRTVGPGGGRGCDGLAVFDFNQWLRRGLDLELQAGTAVDAQFVFDSYGPFHTVHDHSVSAAIHFTVGP